MTRGIERTFSRPFSETFRISKNEDFNGPYLENKNEFLKNSFETVFRASKSCDRGQLVSAFQLTFKQSVRYFPVSHPARISFLVMSFSVISMWLLSNFFILLHSSAKQALGHQEANNRQYPFDKRITAGKYT